MFSHETLKLISHLLQEHIHDESSLENLKSQLNEKSPDQRALFTHIDKDGNGEITLLDVTFYF